MNFKSISIKNLFMFSNKNKLADYFLLAGLIITFNSMVFAQGNGSIGGKVADKTTNEVLIGANIIIIGTTTGASTDIDGIYSIKNLAPGKYTLRYSFISYQSLTVENVEVKPGGETKIDVSLQPASTELDEVVITAEALKSTETSILKIQKNSDAIVDGVSAELISKNNSSDGTDVLKRMTGVTISEGKYAFVRGVGDRYNNTLLNGANLPSTDPEKKSFSYDLFPASLIENVITSKTFTPDKPADFSGGLVEINTVEFPSRFILDVSTSTSYNNQINLKNYVGYNGGGSDYLGYDDGTRDLPATINSTRVGRGTYNSTELQNIGLSFKNNWETKANKAPLNGSFKINVGDKFDFEDNYLGYIASLTYSNSVSFKKRESSIYTFEGPRFQKEGNFYNSAVSWGALLNLSYKFTGNHKISFKNIYNQNADDEVAAYEGIQYYGPDFRKTTAFRYISRSLLSNQLIGEHHLGFFNGLQFGWNINYANSKRDEPDTRHYVYKRNDINDNSTEPLRFLMDPSYANRFFSKLDDNNRGGGADLKINLFENPDMPKVKLGVNFDGKDRDFDARIFGFRNVPGGNFLREDSILQLPVQNIFQPENINPTFIEITEITKLSDTYTAEQEVFATYLKTDFLLFSKLKVVTGVRYEKSTQTLSSFSTTGQPINVDSDYRDVLPSVNLTYLFNEQINFRLGYSKTLARPEFRELAPFSYYDFISSENVIGNPELKRAMIDNYDIRIEMFTGPGELTALSFFYKKFTDPIEQVYLSASEFSPIRSYQNAKDATNYGIELEVRKNLNFLTSLFDNISFVGNVSLIKSEINVETTGFQESNRPLQGQADYILNLGLYYDSFENGLSSSLIYNKVGDRIDRVGFANIGDVIEKPRNQLDFSVSKNIFKNFNLKLAVKDILAEDYLFIQKAPGGDKVSERYKTSSTISVGLSYKL
jgi:TonB-dependent receptor